MEMMTDALSITKEVKLKVAIRDSYEDYPCCIWCGKPAPEWNPTEFSCAHFIPRSHGGLGIEENILTLCPECHRLYDQSENRKAMNRYFAMYLSRKYKNWSEKNLTYKKEG